MKLNIAALGAALTAVAACLLMPAQQEPAYSAVVKCPGNSSSCDTLFANAQARGCDITNTIYRNNDIYMCSIDCGDAAPYHYITGTQHILEYYMIDCHDGNPPTVADARPNGKLCENTTVYYGNECSGL